MMMKKVRVSQEPSSSSSYFPAGEEARARFRYYCLLQDYQELLKETEEKRERLEKTLQKKLQLLAEVKFLRRKSRQFSTSPPPRTDEFEPKQQKPRKSPPPSACIAQPQLPVFQNELALKSRSHKARTAAALFDPNQAFLPIGKEDEWLETELNCRSVDGLSGVSSGGGDASADDAMLSVCRGSGIGSSRAGKRKVAWQDQVALRV